MKIVHVTSALCRIGGGVKAAVENLSGMQDVMGTDVSVLGLSTTHWRNGDAAVWQGARAEVFDVLGPGSYGYAPELSRRLESLDPDIVHLHGLWMYPSKAVADWSRLTGKPYILSPHGMLSPVALSFSPTKKRIAGLLFANRVLRFAACFHGTSEQECSEIRQRTGSLSVVCIPNGIGVPPLESPPKLPRHDRQVLYLGRLHPKKPIERLIDAWARIELEFPDWLLRIAGPSEVGYGEALKSRAVKNRVSRVRFDGPLYGEAKRRAYQAAELFILPTLNENFGLVVGEALAEGTPVICTRGAPWQGLEEHLCGWWIEPEVADIEAALRRSMALDQGTLRDMGLAGREWIKRDFSWETVAKRMNDAYLRCLGGARPTGRLQA